MTTKKKTDKRVDSTVRVNHDITDFLEYQNTTRKMPRTGTISSY